MGTRKPNLGPKKKSTTTLTKARLKELRQPKVEIVVEDVEDVKPNKTDDEENE